MSIPKVVYINESRFREAMLKLRRQGGAHQRAYDKACKLITGLSYGESELNALTHHGESRIKHCRKYDLSNDAHRLVTVHTQGYIYLLHVGTHDEVDHWLNENKGLIVTVNTETKKIQVTHITRLEEGGPRDSGGPNFAASTEENIPYLKRLDEFNVRELVTQSFLVKQLEAIDESSSEDDIQEITGHIAESDPEVGLLLLDILLEMRAGNKYRAYARIEQYRGIAQDVAIDPILETEALESDVNSENLVVLSDLNADEIQNLFAPDKFNEWMIFLHPEQRRIAEKDYDKPTVLTGVSGSGKTCVLVHRARYLARKYPGERILLLTLNRSLSRLLLNLVQSLCSPEEASAIDVMAFYDYFETHVRFCGPYKYLGELKKLAEKHPQSQAILKTIERVKPDHYAREFDPVSKESLDGTWEVFIEQPFVNTLIARLTNRIRSYDRTVDVREYLKEEFSLIRSAVPTSNRRRAYLALERNGRAIRFDEFTRRIALDLLLLFEETMLAGGLLDELSLTLTLLPHFQELNAVPAWLGFRCLLVDEFQDLSTRDIALLRRIAENKENSLFLAGDTVQRILVKDLRLGAIGLDVTTSSWEKIRKNYRNSKQILRAASRLANLYGEEAKKQGAEIDILDPELAERETSKPLAISVAVGQEVAAAYKLAKECLDVGSAIPWAICIATAAPDRISVQKILDQKPKGFPVAIEALSGDYNRNRNCLIAGSISEVKGFEFSMIIIVGCGANSLPPVNGCSSESWRHALRLYVAMTRGRDQVALLYEGKPSDFLKVMEQELEWQGGKK